MVFGFGVPKRPNYGMGAVQSQPLMMPGQEDEFNQLMAMLNQQAQPQVSTIQAPKDRGMFGRFKDFNPLRFDPDKGVGEGNRLYALGAMLSGMGTGDPGLTAQLLQPKLQANRDRVQKREEEARRQQMLQQLSEMPGVTDQQRMLLGMGLGVDQITDQAFAPPSAPKYGLELTEVTDPVTGETRLVQTSEAGGVRPVEGFVPVQQERTYSSAQDATGVRRYTEGPNIGQPVPGFETPRAERGGMQVGVDANGNPVITFGGPNVPSAFGTAGTSLGAKTFGTALETAETADATLALTNRARNIIEGGYSSGVLAPLVGEARRFGREFGLGDSEKVADYEEFTAINNQLAAQMLKLFGGSDTERELAISIASNIGPRFDETTNKRMLNALDQVIEMQRSKPEYIAQWTRRFGSLDALDPQTGLGFQATWDRFLQGQLPNMLGAASDTRQQAIQQSTRLKYNAATGEFD